MAADVPGVVVLRRGLHKGQLPGGWPSRALPVWMRDSTRGRLALWVFDLAWASAASCGFLIAIRLTGSVANAGAVAGPQWALP